LLNDRWQSQYVCWLGMVHFGTSFDFRGFAI
jgi:hypothetical protein